MTIDKNFNGYASMTTWEDIQKSIDANEVRFIELWFTDIAGGVKSLVVPVSQLEDVIENGVHFDGSALDSHARVAESDMLLFPDLNTFSLVAWNQSEIRTARLICNVYTTHGDPFIGDPRNVLIRVLKQAEQMGFAYKTGMELEFFLLHPDSLTALDAESYYDLSGSATNRVRYDILATLSAMGLKVDSTHHEIGSGQQEIGFEYAGALPSADQVLTARAALKAVAQHHGLRCTFMPRPSADMPGSGMHTHQSLHDVDTEENIFVDTEDEYGLSETARYFLAGQLVHARSMAAILAPLVNSYKRLGTSFEAPVYITWAHINRAALIRVPGVQPGKETHTRLELRIPDPSSNPYLAEAVMLQAGLEGIRQKMTLPPPLEETVLNQNQGRLRHMQILPTSLGEALDALQKDDVVLSALGPYISDRYIAMKRAEFAEYSRQVTQWELAQYLDRY